MLTAAAACRIFVGDLGNEVNDDVLQKSFQKFTTLLKAKVVRDKRTNKTKGQCSRPPSPHASLRAPCSQTQLIAAVIVSSSGSSRHLSDLLTPKPVSICSCVCAFTVLQATEVR